MLDDVVARIGRSARYRDVDPALVTRLAVEETARARSTDEAVKRVKRRLHQAVGAFRGASEGGRGWAALRDGWHGDLAEEGFLDACRSVLSTHASTRERLPVLDRLYGAAWRTIGAAPSSVMDLGCGLNPLALPWMRLSPDATYIAIDADQRPLAMVESFLSLVGQPHRAEPRDVVADPPHADVEVALLLKLVPTLDQQDPAAAARLLRQLNARHAVVSFPARSLGGRGKGMERTYRARLDRLLDEVGGRAAAVSEASVPGELVFVLGLRDV